MTPEEVKAAILDLRCEMSTVVSERALGDIADAAGLLRSDALSKAVDLAHRRYADEWTNRVVVRTFAETVGETTLLMDECDVSRSGVVVREYEIRPNPSYAAQRRFVDLAHPEAQLRHRVLVLERIRLEGLGRQEEANALGSEIQPLRMLINKTVGASRDPRDFERIERMDEEDRRHHENTYGRID